MEQRSVHFSPAFMQQHFSSVHDLLQRQLKSSRISSGAGFVPNHFIMISPFSSKDQPCVSGDGTLGDGKVDSLHIRAW